MIPRIFLDLQGSMSSYNDPLHSRIFGYRIARLLRQEFSDGTFRSLTCARSFSQPFTSLFKIVKYQLYPIKKTNMETLFNFFHSTIDLTRESTADVGSLMSSPASHLTVIFMATLSLLSLITLLSRIPLPDFSLVQSGFMHSAVDEHQEAERRRVVEQVQSEMDRRRRKKTEELKRTIQTLLDERQALEERQKLEGEEQTIRLIQALVKQNYEEEQRLKAEQALHEKTIDLETTEKMLLDSRRKMIELDVKESLIKKRESDLKKRLLELEAKEARCLVLKEHEVKEAFGAPLVDIDQLALELQDCQKGITTNFKKTVSRKKVPVLALGLIIF